MLWARAPLFPWSSEPSVFPGSVLSGLSIFNLTRSEQREAHGLGPCISQTPLNPSVPAHTLRCNGASVLWTLALEHFCPVPLNSPSEVWVPWDCSCRGGDTPASPVPGTAWLPRCAASVGNTSAPKRRRWAVHSAPPPGGCEQRQHVKAHRVPGPGPRTL